MIKLAAIAIFVALAVVAVIMGAREDNKNKYGRN